MKHARLLITLLFMAVGFANMSAVSVVAKELLIEQYQNRLKELTTARDSLRVLYYLFDLSNRHGQKEIAWQIYETAGRAQDTNAQIDMLRNLSVFYHRDDSMINEIQKLADNIPNSDARHATKTFIFNQQVSTKSANPDDNTFSVMLLDSIVNSHDLQGHNVYDRIALLYQIMQYIGVESEGSLFTETLDKYAELIDQLPESDYPLKNQFYTTSAIFHSRINGDQRRAVLYDKKLLEIMDMLQEMYVKQKRKYRNYDANKFTSYRRMLSNFKVLTPQELEEYHDSIKMLIQRNEDVRNTYEKNYQSDAYYNYAKGNYKEAIPYIQKSLNGSLNLSVYQKIKFYEMLKNAAKAVGDTPTYIDAMENYIQLEDILDSMRVVTNQREIMLRNSIANAPLLQSPEEAHQTGKKKWREASLIVVSSLLAILLVIYMALYVRLRNSRKTIKSNF